MKATDEQILDAIREYRERVGYNPSFRDMCEATGIRSTSAIRYRLVLMRKNGLIDFDDKLPRTIRVIEQ